MFRQKAKIVERLKTCTWLKHIFKNGNKTRCSCSLFYKNNGKIYHDKGDTYVAGNSPDFHYKRSVDNATR
jgi:hypothetical protein